MASNDQLPVSYPPDIRCFADASHTWDPNVFKTNQCNITGNMVNYLNLTGMDYNPYIAAYCLKPPTDDDCPFGFCPNPDIAGSLVRVANYITGFCLAVLIFYAPKRVTEAFWSQTLITYSLLITCGISLIRGDLTRFHAIVLTSIVCSPVNVYFTGYAIRSFWSTHRLDAVLGRKHHIRRGLTFFSLAVWIAILVDVYLPRSYTQFSQDSCRGSSIAETFFLGTPFLFAWALAVQGNAGILVLFIFLAIPILIVISWIVAITLRRKEIWPPGEPHKPRFGKVWRTVVKNYPFLRFWSVVAIPTVYWIGIIELGILSENEDHFSLTFGQVLAVFAAVPPVIEVLHLVAELRHWLGNLSWVRFARRIFSRSNTGRPGSGVTDPEQTGSPNPELGEKRGVEDELPTLPSSR